MDLLIGDASKAKQKLGWVPKHDVHDLCREMVRCDLGLAQRVALLRREGFDINHENE